MILGHNELKKRYENVYDDEMFTSNGIDYRLCDAQVIVEDSPYLTGIIGNEKKLAETQKCECHNDIFYFKAGKYYLWDLGYHEMLDDCITLFYIRSTLMRSGGQIISSVADKGFHGHIIVGFTCHRDMVISKNERVVQAVFYKADNDGVLYDGDYNE